MARETQRQEHQEHRSESYCSDPSQSPVWYFPQSYEKLMNSGYVSKVEDVGFVLNPPVKQGKKREQSGFIVQC